MMEVDESNDDRFVFRLPLPSLQKMASYQVAQAIWYYYIYRSKGNAPQRGIICYNDMTDTLQLDEKDKDELVGSLGTPRIIDEMLRNRLEAVREETMDWTHFFTKDLFSYTLRDYKIRNFDPKCCIWLANGKIDYKRTAEKMLIAGGLCEVQKFAIMCEYCLIDEITSFDIHRLPEVFVEKVYFSDYCLIYYWLCYVKNELHKVPLDGFASTDAVMAVECGKSHWTAFKYFWNRLGTDDQISVARFLLSSSPYPERLLSMMSWHQQRVLLSLIPEKIILKLFDRHSPQSALWAWKHSKDLINVAQFGEIICTIAQNRNVGEDAMSSFMEIWDTAGGDFRNHVTEKMADEITGAFFNTWRMMPTAFKFLNKFLSMKDAEFRKQSILKNIASFTHCLIENSGMREVLHLCLPLAEDQLKFKQMIMSSDKTRHLFTYNIFNLGNFKTVNTIVEFYSADANAAREYKKQLLKSNGALIKFYIVEVDKWNQLSQFIDGMFPDNSSLALKTKQQYVWSLAHEPDWNRRQYLDDVIEVVEMVFSDDELKHIKKHFLISYLGVLACTEYWWYDHILGREYFPVLSEEYFRKFIKWCSHGDEKVIAYFRNALSDEIDNIFDNILCTLHGLCTRHKWSKLRGNGFDESLLADFDVYLRWCLNGDEELKKYKLDNIMAADNLFAILLKRNDRTYLEILLKWLFSEDEVAIQKFKLGKLELLK